MVGTRCGWDDIELELKVTGIIDQQAVLLDAEGGVAVLVRIGVVED